MKLISACMMVKNEEELLPQCLDSLVGAIDELCIIDTGSTDGTRDVIKKFSLGTHGIRVRYKEIPWNGDFSYMRNETIKMAKCPWVFIIDADERLRFDDGRTLKTFRREVANVLETRKDIKSLAMTLKDWHGDRCVMQCATARMFYPEVRYDGIIHNTPKIDSESGLLMGCYIDHYGYALSEEKMTAKFERTYGSLMKQLHDQPDHPHTEFYLCQLYGTRGMSKEACEWGEKYIARNVRGNQVNSNINPTVFYSLGRMYVELGDLDRANELCQMGFAVNPDDPDLCIVQSDIHARRGHLLEMAFSAKRYLVVYDKLSKSGITGKFYFSLNEATRHVALQRIVIGALGESLNALATVAKTPGVDPGIIEELIRQMEQWGVEDLAKVAFNAASN